jgi:hypothetical protein
MAGPAYRAAADCDWHEHRFMTPRGSRQPELSTFSGEIDPPHIDCMVEARPFSEIQKYRK